MYERDGLSDRHTHTDTAWGALKMTDMKLQDMKMADQIAEHENARHEIDGPSCRARNCRVVCPTKIRKV